MLNNLSGKKIGQYELRDRLGRGGMAEVYKAYQPSMDRFVAIKVMLAHLADDEQFIERFRREARAVGKLRHPHILQVFDFGFQDDIYYMVMEHIKGGNLKAHINEQGKLAPAYALKITSQLADALSYAHNLGMIHRDLKPANVMFVDDAHQNSVLTDFGIARILTETGLTATGMSVGTPAYMSPEAGIGSDTDERSDLYALGVMLYEMLTGNAPYSADTPLAVIMKHINAPLPDVDDLQLPEVVEKVVLKAMAKDPADRYQTAAEMRTALDAALTEIESGAPTKPESQTAAAPTAPPPSTQPTPAKPEPVTQKLPTTEAMSQPAPQDKFPLVGMSAVLVAAVFAIGLLVFLFTWGVELEDDDDNDLPTLAATQVVVAATNTTAPTLAPTPTPLPPPTEPPPPLPTMVAQAQRPAGDRLPGVLPRPGEAPDLAYPGVPPPHPNNLMLVNNLLPPIVQDVERASISGETADVQQRIDDYRAQNPDDYDGLLAQAMLYAAQDDSTAARTAAEQLIEMEPDDPRGYVALSDAHWLAADFEAATEAIETAQAMRPNAPAIMWRFAERAASAGEDERVFAEAERLGASGFTL